MTKSGSERLYKPVNLVLHDYYYIIKEFWEFLMERKKYWLFPIIIVLALFGVLIVLSQGSVVAPFIYTIV